MVRGGIMAISFEGRYSQAAARLRASEIRELLKLLNKPGMISFAGGLPNPDAFPVEGLKPVVGHVMEEHARDALQYGTTEGHNKLRDAIARGMEEHLGVSQRMQDIVITSGSEQALYLVSKVLLNAGDRVITDAPTYLGALLTFGVFGAQVEGVAMDGDGMIPDALEEKLCYLSARNESPKFIYLMPSFQNPTGVTMPGERRRRVYELARRFDLLVVEDDPYGFLRFEGKPEPPIKSMDDDGRVLYLGSFSKILAPGFRIGWLAAPPDVCNKVTLAKQAEDLCTETFGQYVVFEAMRSNLLFPHIAKIVALYRAKRDRMLAAMERAFSSEVRWNRPSGGMFIWVELPAGMDALEMFTRAVERNVAYVVGTPFFPNGGGRNTFRLNFSFASDDEIDEGIRRLGAVIREEIDARAPDLGEEYIDVV
jgi:2-aminoadipate transaminase